MTLFSHYPNFKRLFSVLSALLHLNIMFWFRSFNFFHSGFGALTVSSRNRSCTFSLASIFTVFSVGNCWEGLTVRIFVVIEPLRPSSLFSLETVCGKVAVIRRVKKKYLFFSWS